MYILLLSFFLVSLVYMIFYVMYYKIEMETEIITPYECGFDPYSLTRLVFSYRFYLISILFIIFDVEISLMLPTPFLISMELGTSIFIVFVLILIIGLLYEYYCGSLNWLSNTMSK